MEFIFPPTCGICGKSNKNYICNRCNNDLKKLAEFKLDNYVTETGFYRKNFNEHIYFFKYEGLIRKQILDYKFNGKSYKYKMLSNFIIKNFILNDKKAFQILSDYDIIIPVPISKKRLRERGYNQSELIAKEIARSLKIKLEKGCLYKIKNTIEQSKLDKKQRENNINDVYIIKNKENIVNKKILLLDDIFTTGNTVNECSRVLRQANPSKIGIITIAKD